VTYDIPNQNPYRRICAELGDKPLLLHAVIANSANHISNLHILEQNSSSDSYLHGALERSQIARREAIVARQSALSFLRHALDRVDDHNRVEILTSVLLLINFELMSLRKGCWKVHIDGARRLVEHFHPLNTHGLERLGHLLDCVISDCVT
jgi:Fungal specific transcription factor domain